MPYIMLHTLSHLLLTTVSLECGYPSSTLRGVYASKKGYGILIYTATADAEGTLGGLVEERDGATARTGRHDLSVLADALRERRLVPPFADAAVGRFITSSAASLPVAQCLRTLDAAGAPAGVIVAFLEGIVHDRQARPRTEESIDLVASGPEAVVATNRDTRVRVPGV